MKLIKNNPQIADNAIENISLISDSLLSISICNEKDLLNVSLRISSFYRSEILILKFINVMEYSFYYNNRYSFYNIESYKVLQTTDNHYYLSLDPCERIDGISENDQDFILSERLEIFIE